MQAALHGAVQMAQGAVALLGAENIVDQLEALHIRRYQGIVAAFFEQAGCLAAETGIAHTTGDGVHKGHVFQAGLIPAAQQDHRKQHTAEDGDNQHGKPQVALHQERNILAEQIRRDHGKHIPFVGGKRNVTDHYRTVAAAHGRHAGLACMHVLGHLVKLPLLTFGAVFPHIPQRAGHFVALPGSQQFTVPGHHPGGAFAVEALAGEHAGKQAAALDPQQNRIFPGFTGGIVNAQFRFPGHDQPGLAGLDHILPGQRGTAPADPGFRVFHVLRQAQFVKAGHRLFAGDKFRQRLRPQQHGTVPDDIQAFDGLGDPRIDLGCHLGRHVHQIIPGTLLIDLAQHQVVEQKQRPRRQQGNAQNRQRQEHTFPIAMDHLKFMFHP